MLNYSFLKIQFLIFHFFINIFLSNIFAQNLTIIVTNSSETINGNISSPSALVLNPGIDGISLPEAIYASYSHSGSLSILFDSSLKGEKILLSDNLPTISKGQITINGDIDGDSKPDISIESTNADSYVCFKISASDVTINGFTIINFSSYGIEASTVQNGYGVNALEKVIITNNEISGSWAGISVSNFEQSCTIQDVEIKQNNIHNNLFTGIHIHAGNKQLSSNNQISNIRVINNILKKSGIAIYAQGGTFEGSNNNTISDFLISENRISEHNNVFLLISGGGGLGVQNNKIENLTISNNICENNKAPMEIIGASQTGDDGSLPSLPDGISTDVRGNYISNVKIFGNYINGGGIQFVGAYASRKWPELISSGNGITDVSIGLNTITNVGASGILINSGSDGARGNLIEKMIIFNNLIVKNYTGGGVTFTCGFQSSHYNVINDVEIVNNTIAENGIYQQPPVWAGGICMNANNQSYYNRISNVRIKNNILWGNASNDFINASDAAPTSVNYSILNDSRYKNINNNLYSDPKFVDPENMNYQLQAGSPAVDRGDPNTIDIGNADIGNIDLAGNNRWIDGDNDGEVQIDLGAYEYNSQITDIRQIHARSIPISCNLFQNYPNPFNPLSTITYELSKSSIVQLLVYNILGQKVAELVNSTQQTGFYKVNFNASNLPSGVYVYRLQTGEYSSIKKMIYLK